MSKKFGKAVTKDPESIMFPDIGTEPETIMQLRETIDFQKKDLNEKEAKCGAL